MPRPVPNCPNCALPTGVGADGRCPRCGYAVVPGPTRPLVGSPSPRPDGPGADDWNPGAVILGLYDVQELCGEGGMGRVYRVRHRGWNADLAVKCPRPEWFATEAGKADFEREAATWVNLGLHPHVVTCHYVRRIGGVPRIFAEFVPGGSLADRLRDGPLPPDLALAVAVQAAWGLHFAHEQGLVHQDVKPANILLTAEGVAKVTDFGLARAHRSATGRPTGRPGQSRAVTAAGLCTPEYASPEQLEGRPLTRRADVWAWGVTLLELLTGLRPRHGPSVPELLEEVFRTGPALPPGVTTVLRACFRPEPAERPGSMAELADRLKDEHRRLTGNPFPRSDPRPARARADTLNNRAASLLDLGRTAEAERLLEGVLRERRDHPEANFNLGLLRWREYRVRWIDVFRDLREVVASHPGGWLPVYLLAQLHLEGGRVRAATHFLHTIAAPDSARAEVRLALAHAAALRTDQERAGVIDPDWGGGFEGDYPVPVASEEVETGWRPDYAAPWVVCTAESSETVLAAEDAYERELERASLAATIGDFPRAAECLRAARGLPGCRRRAEVVRGWANLYPRLGRGAFSAAWEGAVLEGHAAPVRAAALGTDGERALSGAADGTLILWDVSAARPVRTWTGHRGGILAVSLAGDARRAVTADAREIKVWDPERGELLRSMRFRDAGGTRRDRPIDSLHIAADGRFALSVHGGNTLCFWEVETGRRLRVIRCRGEPGVAACLSEDGRFALLTRRPRGTLLVWDLARNLPVRTLGAPDPLCARGEEQLLDPAALRRGVVRAENPSATPDPGGIDCYVLNPPPPPLVNYSADGRHAVIADGNVLAVWDLTTNRKAGPFLGHGARVTATGLSLDGGLLVSASDDETIRLWDVRTGACLRVFAGHRGAVTAVAFSTDLRVALSASADGTLKVLVLDWELPHARPAGGWDARVGPLLRRFLSLHTPYPARPPRWYLQHGPKVEAKVQKALTREGRPEWTEEDFTGLMHTLGCAGFGWLRPEVVRAELRKMVEKAEREAAEPQVARRSDAPVGPELPESGVSCLAGLLLRRTAPDFRDPTTEVIDLGVPTELSFGRRVPGWVLGVTVCLSLVVFVALVAADRLSLLPSSLNNGLLVLLAAGLGAVMKWVLPRRYVLIVRQGGTVARLDVGRDQGPAVRRFIEAVNGMSVDGA